MADWSDYYIDREIDKHIYPEKEISRILKEESIKRNNNLKGLSDKDLIFLARKSLEEKTYNERFEKVCNGILSTSSIKEKLSEKQRNAFYGLLCNIRID